MKRLEGKRAVVTGGGSGIGRASAIRFAREGAAVLVVRRAANTNETVEAIRADGGAASGMITDGSKEVNVAAIVERCVNEFGGLEVFFANIGVAGTNTPLLEQTVEEWEEVYRINTISCFLAIKYAGRYMTAKGCGSIILPSSAASLRANAGAILLQREQGRCEQPRANRGQRLRRNGRARERGAPRACRNTIDAQGARARGVEESSAM
jgi:NAD(P)-dependent dehydrogenase (short-subunit alcohol dehydrogenase family)